MFFLQTILATSIRMLALTIHVGIVVYGLTAYANATDDVFQRVGATGRTAISLLDRISLPALTQYDTVWAAGIKPAPFGLPALTEGLFVAPLHLATLSLRGHASAQWVDLQPRAMRAWNLTPSFRVGAAGSLRYTLAPGFSAHFEFLADIHAIVTLDSDWTASCLVENAVRLGTTTNAHLGTVGSTVESALESPLHGPRIHVAVARTIGVWVGSIDIALASGQDLGLTCEAAHVLDNTLRWRASFCTSPFVLCAAIALPLQDDGIAIVIEAAHIEHLGYRTMLGVEFVP